MPIYAYRCAACGFEKDFLQKMSDPVLTDCPQCEKSTLAKQLTAAGFQLKGSGWYATDFKNAAKPSDKKPADGDKPAVEGPAIDAPAKEVASPTETPVKEATPAKDGPAAKAPVATPTCS